MFGIGPTELIVILVIALIVVGPEKLPQLAGQIGKAIRDFRQMSGDVTGEFQRAFQLDEPQPQPPALTDQAIEPAVTPNGVSEAIPTLSAQVIEPDQPAEAAESAPVSEASAATAEVPPVATEYSALDTPPLATKDDPLAGVSMLDEPEPAPQTTTYESQAVASFSSPVAEEPGATNGIADAWDAVLTTDATISLPEPTAAELQPELASAAVAVAEREDIPTTPDAPAEEPGDRPRIDPAAEVTIREVIESQVAAEAFRERRRIATYRRHK